MEFISDRNVSIVLFYTALASYYQPFTSYKLTVKPVD